MKKINLLLPLLFLAGCSPVDQTKINIFAPLGTPSLALANYYEECKDLYCSSSWRIQGWEGRAKEEK